MVKTYGTKSSHETLVPYKRPRKPVISGAEKKRQKASLKTYKPGGDAS